MSAYFIRRVVAVLIVLLLAGVAVQTCRLNDSLARAARLSGDIAALELEKQGWIEGQVKKPDIPDLPPGANPLATGQGSVTWGPLPPPVRPVSAVPGVPGAPCILPGATVAVGFPASAPAGASPTECDLGQTSLGVSCRFELVTTSTARPFGRIYASGTLTGYGQTRKFVETPAGDVEIAVSPSAMPVALPKWEIRAGIATGPVAVLGATRYVSKRLGVWGDVSIPWRQDVNASGGLGVAVRF